MSCREGLGRVPTVSRVDSRERRSKGLIGVVCFLLGAPLLAVPWLLAEHSREYGRRWLIFAFGVMTCVVGFQFLRSLSKSRLPPRLHAALNAAAGAIVFGVFGAGLLAGGLLYGDEIAGGIPFAPAALNNALGRLLFTGFGLILCLGALVFLYKLAGALAASARGKGAGRGT